MKNSKLNNVQGSTLFSDGIRAATDNPQRISTAMDGGGSMQQRDLRKSNLVGQK